MSASGMVLFSLACVVSLVISKPTGAGNQGLPNSLNHSCQIDSHQTEQQAAVENYVITSNDFICGRSDGLLIDLIGLTDESSKILSKVEEMTMHSSLLLHYIDSTVQYNMTYGVGDKLTDNLLSIYELMKNVTISIEELGKSSVYTRDTFNFIRDDLDQLSLGASRIVCSMVVNGLFRGIDVSNIPIGPLPMVSVHADANVNEADVLQMIHEFADFLQQSTNQTRNDISDVCYHRNGEMTTQIDLAVIIG